MRRLCPRSVRFASPISAATRAAGGMLKDVAFQANYLLRKRFDDFSGNCGCPGRISWMLQDDDLVGRRKRGCV